MLKKICDILSAVLILVLVILALALIAPRFLGYQTLAVLSGSMEPNIGVGALVYAKDTDPAELEISDVITYRLSGSTLVTHRVVEIHEDEKEVITKGDANDVNDAAPVSYEQIIGRVDFHIPLLGYISIYIKTPLGIAAICGVLAVLILLVFLPEIFSKEDQPTKEERKE